ncbi:hypothetical protein Tco_0289845 [Tanacetum coccineum]
MANTRSDEESNHEDASDTGAAPKQQQQMIPQTTAISNIKLPILKKEEYDIWAMEMEHYLEYIDNEVWKVIQNGNLQNGEFPTGKDVFEQEIQGASKTSSSAQNDSFVSQSKSSTNKVKSGFSGAYSSCTPSTSSTNIPKKEVLAGFADEQRGHMIEEEERLILSTSRSGKQEKKSDGFADNG